MHLIDAEKQAAVLQRNGGFQHHVAGCQIGGTGGAVTAPAIVFQRDGRVLLAIQAFGIAADTALQPIILGIDARLLGVRHIILPVPQLGELHGAAVILFGLLRIAGLPL